MPLTIQQIRDQQNQKIERDTTRFSTVQDARTQGVQSVISAFNEQQEELVRIEKEKQERQKRFQNGTATKEDQEVLIQISKNAAFKSEESSADIIARNQTISAPKQETAIGKSLPKNNVSYKRSLETQLTKLADKVPILGPLFGSSKQKKFITEDSTLTQQFLAEGAYGVLFGNLLMPPEDKVTRDYADLVATGVDKSTANKLASWRHGFGKIDFKPTALQMDTLRDASKERAIWSLLETIDVVTLGRVTGLTDSIVKRTIGLDKFAFADALKSATTRNEMRTLLIERYPQLKGTQELERIMDLGDKIQSNPIVFDSEISASAKQGKQALKESVIADTEAQKALFQTGRPVLKTIAGDADTVVDVRKAITSALRGEQEATRLSQPDILASEIRAGSLPKNVTPESTVEVFRVGGSGRRAKIGDQVTLSKDIAEEGADSFRVTVSDLVRLSDGTFARVPVNFLGRDLTPSIKAVRDTVTRGKVVAKEEAEKTRLQLERIAKEKAAKRAVQETIERETRDKVIRIEKENKLVKAREVVESAKNIGKGALTKMKTEAVRATRAILVIEKKIVKATQNRTSLLQAATQKAGLTAGRFVQKFGDYMTVAEKNKLKAGKKLTAGERLRIQKRVRESVDSKINKLKSTKDELQATWRKAGSDLVKAKSTLKEADEAKKILAEAGEGVKVKVVKVPKTKAITKTSATVFAKLKPIGLGEKTESTLSQRLITKAKEAGKDVASDINIPFYNKATNTEYINEASAYLSKNGVDSSIDAIMDIADEAVPQQIKPALYNAILDVLEQSGTPEQMQRMVAALSNISEEGTAAGQIVESLKALHRNNPVMRIIDLQKTLKQEVTRRLGKQAFVNAEKEITEQIAKAGTKEDAIETLNSFKICDI